MPPRKSPKKGPKAQKQGQPTKDLKGKPDGRNQTIVGMFQRQRQRMGDAGTTTGEDVDSCNNTGLQKRRSRLSLKRKSSGNQGQLTESKRRSGKAASDENEQTFAESAANFSQAVTSKLETESNPTMPQATENLSEKDEDSSHITTSVTAPSSKVLTELPSTSAETSEETGSVAKDSDIAIAPTPITVQSTDKCSESAKIMPSTSELSSNAEQPSTSKIKETVSNAVDDADSNSGDPEENEEDPYRVPYYLESFLLIVDTIMNDRFFDDLFDAADKRTVELFRGLSDEGQKLYVRLFGRQYRWLRKGKIVYPKIAEDLTATLDELVNIGFVLNEEHIDSLEVALRALAAPELKQLAKSAHLSLGTKAASQKEGVITALLKHSRQKHMGAFLVGGKASAVAGLLKRAKALLGACYYLDGQHRNVFMRIAMLFGLNRSRGDDDESGTLQQQIFQMLMSNIGRVKYPEYTILRKCKVFPSRDSLFRYSKALQIETDLSEALAQKQFAVAKQMYTETKPVIVELLGDKETLKHDAELVEYLRCYTAGSVYIRIWSQCVELLQFTKDYKLAVLQLEQLLEQKVYHPDYRGRWYDRLALNLDHHLKQPVKALEVIKAALADDRVRTGHRYSLFQRAQRLCKSSSRQEVKARWKHFSADPMCCVGEAPAIHIKAVQLAHSIPGGGNLYISSEAETANKEDMTLMKRVEDVVLAHYRQCGYPEGIHGEGGTFRCLFALYFWDLIFMEGIPDVFYTAFQTCPLDIGCGHFYASRKQALDERLDAIRKGSPEFLEEMLRTNWEKHQDTLCLGMNWQRFDSIDHAVGLVKCLNGPPLAGIFQRMLKENLRHTTGGLPDLVVWNPESGACEIIEVKGPGDRLSTKQILWLDYLLSLGVKAGVCHVIAVGSKKIQS